MLAGERRRGEAKFIAIRPRPPANFRQAEPMFANFCQWPPIPANDAPVFANLWPIFANDCQFQPVMLAEELSIYLIYKELRVFCAAGTGAIGARSRIARRHE